MQAVREATSADHDVGAVCVCRLFGNYESLDGGELSEALEDFTGGVSDTLDLLKLEVAQKAEERVALFSRMQKEMERFSLMAASIPVRRLRPAGH